MELDNVYVELMKTEIIFTIVFTFVIFPLNIKLVKMLQDNKYKLLIIALAFVSEFILYFKYVWSYKWSTMLLMLLGYIPAIFLVIKDRD